VACPFFLPVRRLASGGWNPAPRLPLGDAYSGSCQADASGPFEPPEEIQRELCNCGYARGRCAHFPENAAADAVRFSVTGDQDGRVTLIYILEKDHAPMEHGSMEHGSMEHGLMNYATGAGEPLASQARAFVESYLRQSAEGRAASASA
jgi:hypothetical protein